MAAVAAVLAALLATSAAGASTTPTVVPTYAPTSDTDRVLGFSRVLFNYVPVLIGVIVLVAGATCLKKRLEVDEDHMAAAPKPMGMETSVGQQQIAVAMEAAEASRPAQEAAFSSYSVRPGQAQAWEDDGMIRRRDTTCAVM